MDNQIIIREAVTEADIEVFWAQLYAYYRRDILSDPEDGDREHFLGGEYRSHMQAVHDRPRDRCWYLFFERDGADIGFAMPVIFTLEDGKCFLTDFCVFPEFRGGGTGTQCAQALLCWAKERGAQYAELNYGGDARRKRFWSRIGFLPNGRDEWGEPLMLLPPEKTVPITIECLSDPEDWQLRRLESGFRQAVGEPVLTKEQQSRLAQAVRDGTLTVFLAKRGYRAVGMCSAARCFSTFGCAETGVFDDFYIEPAFRRQGIARMLTQAAQDWARAQGLSSLTVCCAPCDEGMYQALGFSARLGAAFAHLT